MAPRRIFFASAPSARYHQVIVHAQSAEVDWSNVTIPSSSSDTEWEQPLSQSLKLLWTSLKPALLQLKNTNESKVSTDMVHLHVDILYLILSRLSRADLMTCRKVCRKLNTVASILSFRSVQIKHRSQIRQMSDTESSIPYEYLRSVSFAGLRGCAFLVMDEHVLSVAKHCGSLVSLNLSGCAAVTDSAFSEVLKKCSLLRQIVLSGCVLITDHAFIGHSMPKHLSIVDARGCRNLTDKFIHALCHLPITHLYLAESKHIHGPSLVRLSQSCAQRLQHLHVSVCGKLLDSHLVEIGKCAYKLRTLHLDRNYGKLTAEGVREFMRIGAKMLQDLCIVLPYQWDIEQVSLLNSRRHSAPDVSIDDHSSLEAALNHQSGWRPDSILNSQEFLKSHPQIRRFSTVL